MAVISLHFFTASLRSCCLASVLPGVNTARAATFSFRDGFPPFLLFLRSFQHPFVACNARAMLFAFDRRPRRRLYLSPCCFLRVPLFVFSRSLQRDVSTVGHTLPPRPYRNHSNGYGYGCGNPSPSSFPRFSLPFGVVCVVERGEERHRRLVATRKRAGVDVTSHARNTSVRERQGPWHDGECTTKQHVHATSVPWKNEGTKEEEEVVWDLQRRTRHERGTSATETRR